jgi:hypothetical protein
LKKGCRVNPNIAPVDCSRTPLAGSVAVFCHKNAMLKLEPDLDPNMGKDHPRLQLPDSTRPWLTSM